jgi:hypothetical protein
VGVGAKVVADAVKDHEIERAQADRDRLEERKKLLSPAQLAVLAYVRDSHHGVSNTKWATWSRREIAKWQIMWCDWLEKYRQGVENWSKEPGMQPSTIASKIDNHTITQTPPWMIAQIEKQKAEAAALEAAQKQQAEEVAKQIEEMRTDVVEVPAPEVMNVYPYKGPGNTIVTLTGKGFQSGVKVFFGSFQSPSVVFKSAGSLVVKVPLGPLPGTSVEVGVANPDNKAAAMLNAYTYT